MSYPILWWVGFNLFVLAMLAIDLGVIHRKSHVISVREALVWSAVWVILALLFNVAVYYVLGAHKALAFLTGYMVERALSLDNTFVFYLVFLYFAVPAVHQHRVLFWGILGALLMRAAFIALGVTLVQKFEWLFYILGAFLVVAGIRMAFAKEKEVHPEKNPIFRLLRRAIPVTHGFEGRHFFVRRGGRLLATPLLIVLLFIEMTDVVFAIDSVPAILAITTDPFIVYTSNVFAILGLRAMYFALAGIIPVFEHLHYGLSIVLVFVGVKMLLGHAYEISILASLAVITAVLMLSIAGSVLCGTGDCSVRALLRRGRSRTGGDDQAVE